VYDSQLVQQKHDSVSTVTPPGAGQSGSPSKVPPGTAGNTGINVGSPSGSSNLDGVPTQSDESDAGPSPQCGDGRVGGNELCDIALTDGQAGACPTSCPPEEDCVPRVLTGSDCHVECVRAQGELGCLSGDHCCPPSCMNANDSDCSARCGNGLVEDANSETCEPGSSKPCISDAAECDDKNACTVDSLTGAPEQCNVKCVHRAIVDKTAGDNCCPEGASSVNDADCKPRCGNHVIEAGETCDGEPGCDGTCMLHNNEAEVKCLALAKTECDRCACMHCTGTELACRYGAEPKANMACESMLACSAAQKCTDNTQCYCGPLACLTPVLGVGPCKEVIDTAAQAFSNRSAIDQAAEYPPTTPVGFAAAADNCRVQQCRGACR
jgi:hypothetical protein